MRATFWNSLFSFQGRVSRSGFLAHTIGGFLLTLVIMMVLIIVLGGQGPVVMRRAVFAVSIFTAANQLSLFARRLHDCGLNGVGALLIFVPGINVIFVFYMLFMPGQKRPNKYGLPNGARATDLLSRGREFESQGKWKAAFECYAGVVDSEQFSYAEEEYAIQAVVMLKERLAAEGITHF